MLQVIKKCALLCAIVLAAGAMAQDAALLAQAGYPPGQYSILMAWTEQAPARPAALVQGVRLQPSDGSPAVDLYFLEGTLLGKADRQRLGLAEKSWNRGPREASLTAQGKSSGLRPPAPEPKSITYGMQPKSVTAIAVPDVAALIAEDEANSDLGKPSNRTGVFQPLPDPLQITAGVPTRGAWVNTPDGGSLWSLELTAPDAVGLRLHVTVLNVPTGGGFVLFNPDQPNEAFGPYNAIDPRDPSLWTPTTYGERVVLECYLPAGYAVDQVNLNVAEVAYLYHNPLSLTKAAGLCNLDSTCEPAWADTALAVCGLGVIGQSGTVFCTGALIADTDTCTDANYILTANHCVSAQFGARGAASLEFYWEYQTATCNGSLPNPATVPRTIGGADFLAGAGGRGDSGGGNDFTLMRLRNAPPANIPAAGWTTNVPAQGAPLTSIHHPRGDYKRISMGSKTNTANPFSALYHEVTWTGGTTEPGSSGSPLFLDATQQIIGQLWGGGASCAEPDEPDFYGRFDVTYPVVAAYLDPQPAAVAVSPSAPAFSEGAGAINIPVTLSAPSGGSVSVDYTIQPGTAQPGVHYTAIATGTLHFAMGVESQDIPVTLIDNTHLNTGRTFTITLSNASCAQVLAGDATATVTIEEDDLDSDNDGVSDADELSGYYGPPTNPNLADTDGDGLTDGQELAEVHGFDTDPTNPDTDGDGVRDYDEILLGLDPTNGFDVGALSSMTVPWFEEP